MNNIKHLNTYWDKTRICPTAVVLRSCAGEIFSIFVQNKDNHRWNIFPWGKIEPWETNIQSALRELVEETWRNDISLLTHVWNLWTLYRQWGTDPKNEREILLLDMKPAWEKYLYVKKQIYELFVIEHEMCPEASLSHKPIGDIAHIQTMMLYPDNQRDKQVTLTTDRHILSTITDYLAQSGKSIHTIQSDLAALQAQVAAHHDKLFS